MACPRFCHSINMLSLLDSFQLACYIRSSCAFMLTSFDQFSLTASMCMHEYTHTHTHINFIAVGNVLNVLCKGVTPSQLHYS